MDISTHCESYIGSLHSTSWPIPFAWRRYRGVWWVEARCIILRLQALHISTKTLKPLANSNHTAESSLPPPLSKKKIKRHQADGSGSPASLGKDSRQGKRRCLEVPLPASDAAAPTMPTQHPTPFMGGVSPCSLSVSCPSASQSATPGNTSNTNITNTNTSASATRTSASASTPALGSGSGVLSFENEVLASTDLKNEVQLHVEAGGVDGLDIAKGLWVDDPRVGLLLLSLLFVAAVHICFRLFERARFCELWASKHDRCHTCCTPVKNAFPRPY